MKYGISYKEFPKEYKKLQSRDRRMRDPLKCVFASAKSRAKKLGTEFTVEFDDLVIPEFCPVFGIKLEFQGGKRHDGSFSLDRRDNSKGYTKENTCVISWKANQYKGNMTIEQVEALLKYMKGI